MLTKSVANSLDVDSFLLGDDADIVMKSDRKAFSSELGVGQVGASLSELNWSVIIRISDAHINSLIEIEFDMLEEES